MEPTKREFRSIDDKFWEDLRGPIKHEIGVDSAADEPSKTLFIADEVILDCSKEELQAMFDYFRQGCERAIKMSSLIPSSDWGERTVIVVEKNEQTDEEYWREFHAGVNRHFAEARREADQPIIVEKK